MWNTSRSWSCAERRHILREHRRKRENGRPQKRKISFLEEKINNREIKDVTEYISLSENGKKIFLIDEYNKRISFGGYRLLEDENGKNYSPSLKPGESTQVVMAWIMDEPDLENMYLNLDSGGGSYFIGTDELKTGLIAIGEAASEER